MDWKKEIALLKEKQKGDEYGEHICDCIYEVMDLISKQGHSGMSFSFLASYLKRLLSERPIFPITADPNDWEDEKYGSCQNKRCYSIFLHKDGTIHDTERAHFYDVEHDISFTSGMVSDLIDKIDPITLPYMPPVEPYIVVGASLLLSSDENGNDIIINNVPGSNYVRIDYIKTPKGRIIPVSKSIDYRKLKENEINAADKKFIDDISKMVKI